MKQIVLINYGGPEEPSQVRNYLFRLFSDQNVIHLPARKFYQKLLARIISRLREKKSKKNYEAIGGSPIISITQALVQKLNRRRKHLYYAAMAFSPPFINHVLDFLPLKDVFIFPLFPHFSKTTTGACLDLARKSSKRIFYLREYWADPDFNSLIVKRVNNAASNGKRTSILFSAHSIPLRYAEKGDPYFKSIHSHFRLLQNLLPQNSLFIAFQSRLGLLKWAGPSLKKVLYRIKDQEFKSIVLYPMSFTIDNYETSYEIDRYYRNDIIHKLNFSFKRIPYLNDSKDFISFIEKKIDEGKWLELA